MELDPDFLAQLLETFQGELDDQIQVITAGLIGLEKHMSVEEHLALLDGMFRAAHNIKGAARGIEVSEVADVAHHLESVFFELKQRSGRPDAATIDVALQALDVMKAAMAAYRQGQSIGPALIDIVTRLRACQERPVAGGASCAAGTVSAPAADVAPKSSTDESAVVAREPVGNLPAASATTMLADESPGARSVASDLPAPAKPAAAEGSEAIRVRVDKLSRISAMAEDLVVTQVELKDHYKEMLHLVAELYGLKRSLKHARGNHQPARRSAPDEPAINARLSWQVDALLRQATTLSGDMHQISRRMDFISNAMQDDARMLRLVPAISVLQPLVRAGRDIGQQLAKRVEVAINGGDIEVDKALIDRIRDPLMHLLRNAIDHGLESTVERQQQNKPAAGQVTVSVNRISSQIEIRVQDDGRGIDVERLKQVAVERGELRRDELQTLSDDDAFALMFRPGFTVKREVSDISGRGVGLDVVKSNIQELKGQVRVESVRGECTSFVITLPLTLSTERGLQVDVGGTTLVIPSVTVQRIIEIEPEDILHIEGDHAVLVDGAPVPVRDLGGMLELPCQSTATHGARSAVVVHRGTRSMALLVDQVEGEREIVIKPLRYPLASVRYVSGATLTRQGQVIMVLSVPDLLDQFNTHIAQSALPMHLEVAEEHEKPHVLVVDDSITTRTLERNILEIHGYQVTVAMNGLEAWNLLQHQAFDLVVTDVEMPEMDGFTLTQRVRNDDALRETPVVIVSSLAKEEEQRRGLEVGASAYIVKGTFETQVLLDAVRRII